MYICTIVGYDFLSIKLIVNSTGWSVHTNKYNKQMSLTFSLESQMDYVRIVFAIILVAWSYYKKNPLYQTIIWGMSGFIYSFTAIPLYFAVEWLTKPQEGRGRSTKAVAGWNLVAFGAVAFFLVISGQIRDNGIGGLLLALFISILGIVLIKAGKNEANSQDDRNAPGYWGRVSGWLMLGVGLLFFVPGMMFYLNAGSSFFFTPKLSGLAVFGGVIAVIGILLIITNKKQDIIIKEKDVSPMSIADKLKEIDTLLEGGNISQEEYEGMRSSILASASGNSE